MSLQRHLSFIPLLCLPIFGCSTTSDFAEELHGDWYAEGSCDLVKISTEETTGKMWNLAGSSSSKSKDDVDDMMKKAKAEAGAAAKKAKAAYEKTAKKEGGPTAGKKAAAPSAAKKASAATPKKSTSTKSGTAAGEESKEDQARSKISGINDEIASVEAEQPLWKQLDFNLKLKAAQKEIKVEGDKKTILLDGIFVNGEGCKGTATLSGDNLVFAFQKNAELEGTAKPAQSLCANEFTLFSKKPETCATPVELNEAKIKKLNANLKTAKEELRKVRNTPGSRAMAETYPHACNDIDPKLHTKITGLKGQCAPRHVLRLTQAGWLTHDFTSAPSRFSDSNEISHLLSPKKENGEKTTLTAKELQKTASRTKKKVFYDKSGPKQCKPLYESGVLKVTCEMPVRGLYISGSPGYKRDQKCENNSYTPSRCSDRCDSHSDCNGWFCGCGTSRCNIYGQCTPCPTEYSRDCKDPEFTVTGVSDWTTTKKISAKRKAAASALEKSIYSSDAYFLFRMENAFRKIYQKTEDGETEVEGDSGYIIKAKPLLLAYENEHGPLIMHTAAFTAYHKAKGNRFKVTCSEKGLCEIEKK